MVKTDLNEQNENLILSEIYIFCHCEGINPEAREEFNPSNKNEVCQGAGKSHAAALDFP